MELSVQPAPGPDAMKLVGTLLLAIFPLAVFAAEPRTLVDRWSTFAEQIHHAMNVAAR